MKTRKYYKFIKNKNFPTMLNNMFQPSKTNPELQSIEKDLISFYDYCKSNGFTEEEMQEICQPLNYLLRKTALYQWLRKIFMIATIFIILYLLMQSETLAWNLAAIGRIILVKLLPIWDWELLRNEKCMIPNFVKPDPQSPILYHCAACENMDGIPVESNSDPYLLSEIYIDTNVPVIISDGIRNWPSYNDKSFDLSDTILSDKKLASTVPCDLSSNMIFNSDSLETIIKKSEIFTRWYFHFQNCNFTAVKQFRLFAVRPYFFKPEVLPVQYSWLLVSKNYQLHKFKKIELSDKITVFGQISGSNVIQLSPRSNCVEECPTLEVELQSGEAIIFTSLWDLEYKPGLHEYNAAVILETH